MEIKVETGLGYNTPPDLMALYDLLVVIAENLQKDEKVIVTIKG